MNTQRTDRPWGQQPAQPLPDAANSLIHHMDRLFEEPDPWRYRTSAYEARKRAITMACLPDLRYGRGFEPGCANGALSELLAARCSELVCADASAGALHRAVEQVGARQGVQWRQLTVPQHWPEEHFDLIVLSEFLYYLDAQACTAVAQQCLASLTPGGSVLACHWRGQADDFVIQGSEAHGCLREVFHSSPEMAAVRAHREADFLIDVWSMRSSSPAAVLSPSLPNRAEGSRR
ncbi:Nodulation protein S (NodS) [Roseateles sp. YR242]|uniref:SAM-dependent methyltransferase n=1 Tax=Roseateles sp. YR242 TaxID=1855305 RepID=UPI0008B83A22|nr:SAM-dependent methyltransferase [Roseateles sp. YR242]SEL21154.1 Nodulation protein S (NodS) [Roseateles sp. YR242]